MDSEQKPWFGRHRIGWGWGPTSWQGWLVVAAYAVALTLIGHAFPPSLHRINFLAGVAVATAILLAVSIWKGERHQGR